MLLPHSVLGVRGTLLTGNTIISLFVETVQVLVVHISSGDMDRHNGIAIEAAEVLMTGNTSTCLREHKVKTI
jgi:hypothetical protein